MPEPLTDEERVAFEEAASRICNAICHDMGWTLRLPVQSIFVDAICDQIDGPHSGLTPAQVDRFRALPFGVKRRIILTAL